MMEDSYIGDFLLKLMAVSQTFITFSVIVSYIYRFFIKTEEEEWLKTFYREVKPVQLVLGAVFLLWWMRSNDWKSKTLKVTPTIRMTLLQFSLVSFYIAFDLVVQNWENPEMTV